MSRMRVIRSPIFYMGNKLSLIKDLLFYFPDKEDVNEFIDLFGGSGVVSLNVPYGKVIYNELNTNIVELFKLFSTKSSEEIINHIEGRIKEFNLPDGTIDIRQNNPNVIEQRKDANKSYNKFRTFYNKQQERNYLDLYTLTFFSFCNLIRFNQKSEFNMPFGDRHFNQTHKKDIEIACYNLINKSIEIKNNDAFEVLSKIKENKGQFIYLDPPYANTTAIYNEQRAFGGWGIEDDNRLFNELDRLNGLGIKWALSNVLENKGIKNTHIEEWAINNNYNVIELDKNYSALGKGNANSREVLIINYKPKYQQMSLLDLGTNLKCADKGGE